MTSVLLKKDSLALDALSPFYEEIHLLANSSKTQVCAFHLHNRYAKRQLNVSWSVASLENCDYPVYLGVTIARCLSFNSRTMLRRPKPNSVQEATLSANSLEQDGVPAQTLSDQWPLPFNIIHVIIYLSSGASDQQHILSGIEPPNVQCSVDSSRECYCQTKDE